MASVLQRQFNQSAPDIRIQDPVCFATSRGQESGFVAAISGRKADVVALSGDEYVVPLFMLARRPGESPKRVFTTDQMLRCAFRINDTVSFQNKGKKITGAINQLNPTRARVTDEDTHWNVPYSMLHGEQAETRKQHSLEKLTATAQLADRLLEQHGLKEWRFTYDNANKRAGSCDHTRQIISMAEQFCLTVDADQIADTLLHEIAHALVGARHGHDAIWQAKAREIGCSAERTHCINFSAPRYIVSCKSCGTYGARDKRGKNQVCKRCKTPITYELYSEALWNAYQK